MAAGAWQQGHRRLPVAPPEQGPRPRPNNRVVAVIAQRYSYSPQSWGFLPLIALQGGLVKLIIAIIQPSRLESVKEALSEV